jgi:hypothetical protein
MADKEYIEREAAIKAILGQPPEPHYPEWYYRDIKEIPAADVAPVVHAEWVDIFSLDNNENVIATCNYCKERGKVRTARNEWGVWYINSPRCPHCGAKMKGK